MCLTSMQIPANGNKNVHQDMKTDNDPQPQIHEPDGLYPLTPGMDRSSFFIAGKGFIIVLAKFLS